MPNKVSRLHLIKQRQVFLKSVDIFNLYYDLPINSVSANEIIRRLSRNNYLTCDKKNYKKVIVSAGIATGWKYDQHCCGGVFFRSK